MISEKSRFDRTGSGLTLGADPYDRAFLPPLVEVAHFDAVAEHADADLAFAGVLEGVDDQVAKRDREDGLGRIDQHAGPRHCHRKFNRPRLRGQYRLRNRIPLWRDRCGVICATLATSFKA